MFDAILYQSDLFCKVDEQWSEWKIALASRVAYRVKYSNHKKVQNRHARLSSYTVNR